VLPVEPSRGNGAKVGTTEPGVDVTEGEVSKEAGTDMCTGGPDRRKSVVTRYKCAGKIATVEKEGVGSGDRHRESVERGGYFRGR